MQNRNFLSNEADFSVVLFRPNFTLFSEKNYVKVHTNQRLLTMPYPLECLAGATSSGHTRGPGGGDAFAVTRQGTTPLRCGLATA